jgi:hypothetical protein
MELPYYALHLVREFSRPLTRPDWMTCKAQEADIIYQEIQAVRDHHRLRMTIWGQVDPFRRKVYDNTIAEIDQWTHYGRALIFKQPVGWTMYMPPVFGPDDDYLRQFVWLVRKGLAP